MGRCSVADLSDAITIIRATYEPLIVQQLRQTTFFEMMMPAPAPRELMWWENEPAYDDPYDDMEYDR